MIDRIETAALRKSKPALRRILEKALRDVQKGRRPNLDMGELEDLLKDAMILARNAARQRVAESLSLSLALVPEPPSFLDQVFDALGESMVEFLEKLVAEGTAGQVGGKALAKKAKVPVNTADTLFKTFTQWSWSAGEWDAYQDPDVQDILWGFRYSTVGDGRVRLEHAVLEGVTYPKDHAFWATYWPPNGWRCRCTTIPVLDEGVVVAPKYFPYIPPIFAVNPAMAA